MNIQKNKRISDVYFSGEFFFHKANEKKGRKTTVNTDFIKDGRKWTVLSYYTCSAGLVFDICIETDFREFSEYIENGGKNRENPLDYHFDIKLIRNKKLIDMSHMQSIEYIPGNTDNPEAEKLIKLYKLSPKNCRSFYRICFPCRAKSRIQILSLKILPINEYLKAAEFSSLTDKPVEIIHPLTKKKYELRITETADEVISFNKTDERMIFPENLKIMKYTISPEPDVAGFIISDKRKSDNPEIRSDYKYLPDSSCSIAIIGGADGPTAVFSSLTDKTPAIYSVCSSLYFGKQKEIIWVFRFIEKIKEEKIITIKGGSKNI